MEVFGWTAVMGRDDSAADGVLSGDDVRENAACTMELARAAVIVSSPIVIYVERAVSTSCIKHDGLASDG